MADKLDGEVKEIFLPRDFGEFCIGCTQCFHKSETLCPHYEKLKPLTKALDEADLAYWREKGWDKDQRPWN